jgi:serine/threonine protein kinase
MAGCPARGELKQYVTRDDSLGPEWHAWIEAHVEECFDCQRMLDDLTPEDVPTGTTMPDLGIHGYRVYKFLGSGAFGEVWLAQDLNLPRVVAVKTIRVGTGPDERRRALQALRRDANLLTQVRHANVVQIYAWVTVGERHFLVMQYVAGGSLADLLAAEGPLLWQRAARYIADVGEGLVAVHKQGIVHRDVKPANILWEPKSDEALLTDFGVGSWLADPASIAGSLAYMAPEAYDGKVSPSLDVYGLAATLFHLVTGFQPFAGTRISDFKAQIAQGLPDPDPRCRELPAPLERVIRAGLSASPNHRPGLREFVESLRGSLNQLLADTISAPQDETRLQASVPLRLNVSRLVNAGRYEHVAATHPRPDRLTRDMKRVPKSPDQVCLRTGDQVRIEAVADRPGYLTVFNVGPAGHLNLLYPDPLSLDSPAPVEAHRPLNIPDVEMTPPAGQERLFAVWTRQPLSLRLEQLHSLVQSTKGDSPPSRPYVATRDMKRVQQSVEQLRPEDWHAVGLELDHWS